jgi:hypothetical protein
MKALSGLDRSTPGATRRVPAVEWIPLADSPATETALEMP